MRLHMGLAAIVATLTCPALIATDAFPARGGDITITPIIHSSLQVEHGGIVIQVDPWSRGDLTKAKPADLILISDIPDHHLDVKAIQQLRKPGAPIIIPEAGRSAIPDGIVLSNGQSTSAAGVRVESIAAYDIKPGRPEHPKGKANGYVITVGEKRIYFAGVTECVPELQALSGRIDIAFLPMNTPPNRMTPSEAAACAKILKPKVVYVYHYDGDYARTAATGVAAKASGDGGVGAFVEALKGEPIQFHAGNWYPDLPAR